MKIELLTRHEHIQDMEYNAASAALTCRANTDKPFVPSDVLKRIIKAGHESILEHITLTFSIKSISRALLQELARHRHISLSVESTRHTLRKQLQYTKFFDELPDDFLDFAFAFTKFADAHPNLSNDELKYYLPEFWPTNLILTSNIRELRHILNLRTAPNALKEFQELAYSLFDEVPNQFEYLLQDCVHVNVPSDSGCVHQPRRLRLFVNHQEDTNE